MTVLVLIALASWILIPRNVSAQSTASVQVTNVTAPPSVAPEQSLTVSITVSYDFGRDGDLLEIEVARLTEMGLRPVPNTVSMSSNCGYPSDNTADCWLMSTRTNAFPSSGVATASFTLNAPTHSGVWHIVAVAYVESFLFMGGGYEDWLEANNTVPISINVATPVPETLSPSLLMFVTLIATVYLIRRRVKPTQNYFSA